MSLKRILLVEDEENFGSLLKNYLELSKYECTWCKTGTEAYSVFAQNEFDLCILDVMLPHMDGFTLAKKIRAKSKSIPLFFLTAKNAKVDLKEGYAIGADDYLTKPFDTEILLLKISALFNRKNDTADVVDASEYNFGIFRFLPKDRMLSTAENEVKLSPKESSLLALLCKYENTIMPRKEALLKIWEEENYFTKRSMDVYITKLRKHLKVDPLVTIDTFHQTGFQLRVKS
ncbi:MAG: two-component system OmpR family response regulator [Crocinitomix sp.]|jgi:two-component system OmpR family response regulator